MKTRQHWAVFLQPHLILIGLFCLFGIWALFNPHVIVSWFHLTTATPGIKIFEGIYGPWKPFVIYLIGLIFVLTVSGPFFWWSITWYQVANGYLKYQMGPFKTDDVPIVKIQDVSVRRGMAGLMFGYGTIFVDAGKHTEPLSFVPDPENFARLLQHGT